MACPTNRLARYPYLANLESLELPGAFSLGADADYYDNLKAALESYRDGTSLKKIEETYGLSRQLLYHHRDRFAQIGARALVKFQQIRIERRGNPELLKSAGAGPYILLAFFEAYPKIREFLYEAAVLDKVPGQPKLLGRLSYSMLHEHLLAQATAAKVPNGSYPFNKDAGGDQGWRALRDWVIKNRLTHEREERLKKALRVESDPMRIAITPATRVYRRFQFDGHYVDVNWTIEAPDLRGTGVLRKRVRRVWLLSHIDEGSSAVPGYAIAFGKNYKSVDVLRAHRACLVPWQPMDVEGSSLRYRPGQGLPNGVIPELAYACAEEIWEDNAKSHLSDLHLTVMERTTGSVLVFGPVGAPNVRPHIEGAFDILEEAGIHPTYGTTGSNPRDKRRRRKLKPHYLLTLRQLLLVIDILIARWNGSKAPGSSLTRLEILQRAVQSGRQIFRYVPTAQRAFLNKYDTYEICHVGFRKDVPGVSWHGTWFSAPSLLKYDLKNGEPVLIGTHSRDVTELGLWRVSDATGLGSVAIEKRWSGQEHCLWALQSGARTPAHETLFATTGDLLNGIRADAAKGGRSRSKPARTDASGIVTGAGEQAVPVREPQEDDAQVPARVNVLHPPNTDALSDEALDRLKRLGPVY